MATDTTLSINVLSQDTTLDAQPCVNRAFVQNLPSTESASQVRYSLGVNTISVLSSVPANFTTVLIRNNDSTYCVGYYLTLLQPPFPGNVSTVTTVGMVPPGGSLLLPDAQRISILNLVQVNNGTTWTDTNTNLTYTPTNSSNSAVVDVLCF